MTRLGLSLVAIMLVLVCLAPTRAEAQPKGGGPFGLGIILYEPTGLTGKYWFTNDQALDFHLGLQGLGRGYDDDFGIYVDYLFHFDLGVHNSYFTLPLYLGPGGAIIFDDDDRWCNKWGCYNRNEDDDDIWLSARMPVGLAFLFSRFPGEAFIELSLQLWLVPITDLDLDAALGFRFYF